MTAQSHLAPYQDLEQFIREALRAAGAPENKARLVAETLVSANLRGIDSHGVHLLPRYIEQLRAGNINPAADGRVVSESGACMLFDGEHGIGQSVANTCCRHAVRLAKEHGLGMVVARDSNHFGIAATWGKRISDAGMIGVVMCNASPSVAPWQGRDGRIGTNPICVSMPSTGNGAWLLDMATTTVAMNKIVRAAARTSLATGATIASHTGPGGAPTTDTRKASQGLLMPLGGYKGSGLGLMAEILCAVLSGGVLSTEVGGLHILDRKMNTSQMFLAIAAARFLSPEQLQARMEYLIPLVKSARPAKDFDEVLVAGEPERRIEMERREAGIPIDTATWNSLEQLATELNVALP